MRTTIRLIRTIFDITQTDLASSAGVSLRTLQRIEEGAMGEPETMKRLDAAIKRTVVARIRAMETL